MSEIKIEPGWEAHLDAPLEQLNRRIGEEVLADMAAGCPVETGALKASLRLDVDSSGFRIGSDKDYAAPVELGHRDVAWGHDTGKFIPADPFMRRALYRQRGA